MYPNVTQMWSLVTSPKVHWSEGSVVRKVTGPNSNPNPYRNPIPNLKVVFDLIGIRKHYTAFQVYTP